DMFHEVIAHGMWGGALISAVLGTELPGPGTIYLNQSLSFRSPVGLGDTVTVRVSVKEKKLQKNRLILDCLCLNQDGDIIIKGEADVIAPTEKVRRPRAVLPDVHLHERGARYQELIDATRELDPIRTAVVHPCDPVSLSGALDARDMALIDPVLVGPRSRIEGAATEAGVTLDGVEIVDTPHSHAAAARAVELSRAGEISALMKGALHTDELMSAVLKRDIGLRTERRLSHVFAFDVPHYPKPLFITDAAINIYPDLACKKDIVQNAIDLAQTLGVEVPKVAILSAVETVYPKIAGTVEAAALCKMADRGQITGGIVDGPLAFDNAISPEAARIKGIVSPVAGNADILVTPDLETGNMLGKQLLYLAGAEAAGVVLGARVPIMLTSRADGTLSRLASAAVVQLYANCRNGVPS
ncbi:MAG: bifunctional enoyl-CoA hydratase/phosphate acetyltransferase, partial [Hyphomicrobiaceae bacterium]